MPDGRCRRVRRTTWRNTAMWRTSRSERRSSRLRVKNGRTRHPVATILRHPRSPPDPRAPPPATLHASAQHHAPMPLPHHPSPRVA